MLIRAVIAFLALPGVIGGLLPALLVASDVHRSRGSGVGWVLLGTGVFLLVWCVRDFFVSGRGTLAPWDPPRHLVVVGLYRSVRNPMYLAVLTLVVGWSMATGSGLLAWYAGALAIVFHLRVVFFEEPWLQRQFGAEWRAYSATVWRWLPRVPASGDESRS